MFFTSMGNFLNSHSEDCIMWATLSLSFGIGSHVMYICTHTES